MNVIFQKLKQYLPQPVKSFLRERYIQISSNSDEKNITFESVKALVTNKPTIDLVISPNEISFAHGTGVLLARLMEDHKSYVVIRSRTDYGGEQRVNAMAEFSLPNGSESRCEIFKLMGEWLDDYNINSILCAPYFETDLTLAIAAQAISGAPLGLWIMDDNCLQNTGISRSVMSEAIERASALFAISPELKRIYQTEFGKSMCLLPPLVSPDMIQSQASKVASKTRLTMIGNLWSQSILERFSEIVRDAGLIVDWYSSNPELWEGYISKEKLAERGINIIEWTDSEQLREAIEASSCVVVPSDHGESGPHETALGNMSLPTRIPFIVASAGTPIIVIARPGTAAGSFVESLDIGAVVPYEADALKSAVNKLSQKNQQKRIRKKCAEIAEGFSFAGASDFVFKIIQAGGRWHDERYEKLIPANPTAFSIFVDKPVPKQYAQLFGEVLNFCDRLKSIGYEPDFILDVGASTGIWSLAVNSVFDQPRFILCDPMFSRYPDLWAKPEFELVEAAISDKSGEATFSISGDLYGSSLIKVSDVATVEEEVTVPVKTVDQIMSAKKVKGSGIMKVDVQYAEHLVIDGALKSLKSSIDVVILELTLVRVHSSSKTMLEVANQMEALGFRILDQVGHWRIPSTGEMEQLDVVFVRKDLKLLSQDVIAPDS